MQWTPSEAAGRQFATDANMTSPVTPHLQTPSTNFFCASRAHYTRQNLNTDVLEFLVYETAIPVLILIPVFQKQTFFLIHFDGNWVQ
jgi:hypothetical protein